MKLVNVVLGSSQPYPKLFILLGRKFLAANWRVSRVTLNKPQVISYEVDTETGSQSNLHSFIVQGNLEIDGLNISNTQIGPQAPKCDQCSHTASVYAKNFLTVLGCTVIDQI